MTPPTRDTATPASAPQQPRPPGESEFGDLENLPWTGITVVIAVLGLLLFMAVPLRQPTVREKLTAQRQREAVVALETIGRAIEDYRTDHGVWPGARALEASSLAPPVFTTGDLVRQLEQHTDRYGATLPTPEVGYDHGPYLPNGLPRNPGTGLRSVRILEEGESFGHVIDGLYGWIYDPRTGEVRPHELPFPGLRSARQNTRHGGLLQR